jgi:hypothetical protein
VWDLDILFLLYWSRVAAQYSVGKRLMGAPIYEFGAGDGWVTSEGDIFVSNDTHMRHCDAEPHAGNCRAPNATGPPRKETICGCDQKKPANQEVDQDRFPSCLRVSKYLVRERLLGMTSKREGRAQR